MGNRDYGKSSGSVKKMADGGAVGGESVSLWERLKAGNKDQEGSEAYNRWGAGAEAHEKTAANNREVERLASQPKVETASSGASSGGDYGPEPEKYDANSMSTEVDVPKATPAKKAAKPKRAPLKAAGGGAGLAAGIAQGMEVGDAISRRMASREGKEDAVRAPYFAGAKPAVQGNDPRVSLANSRKMADGGLVGQAKRALEGRRKQLDDAEGKYADGGKVGSGRKSYAKKG